MMTNQEHLRDLLKHELSALQSMAESVQNEVIYKAVIVREFMQAKGIDDARSGLREFYAFQRERLQRLGWAATA